MNTNKILVVFLITMILSAKMALSQNNINVTITDVKNESLKSKMQANASELLSAINKAFAKKNIPKPSSGSISKDVMPTLLAMWETSTFNCSSTDICTVRVKNILGKDAGS